MKRKQNLLPQNRPKNSILFDYINFGFILIFGYFFDWSGNQIVGVFLIQLGVLYLSLWLYRFFVSLYLRRVKHKEVSPSNPITRIFMFFTLFYIFFIWQAFIQSENFWEVFIYSPFVLYAKRHMFQKSLNNPLFEWKLFKNVFLMAMVGLPALLILMIIFYYAKPAPQFSFILIYSVLCFPYKGTFNLLFSEQKRKTISAFFQERSFALVWILVNFVFLFAVSVPLFAQDLEWAPWPFYAFPIFCILIGFLMMFHKVKPKK